MSARGKAGYSILDLFAGAGGLTSGFVAEGFQPAAAVESDVAAAATYVANFGGHVYAGDIEEFAAGQGTPQVDVVIGGPPCQGFSNLGLRRTDDPRNKLWESYAGIVARARPWAFVLENVDLFEVSEEFEGLRRDCEPGGRLEQYKLAFADVVNAADFGAAQRRRRTIVIGLHSAVVDSIVPPQPTHGIGPGRLPWVTVRDRIGELPRIPMEIDLPTRFTSVTLPCGETARVRGPFRSDELHLGRRPTQMSLDRFRAIPPGGNWRDLPWDLRAPCWQRRTTHGSGDVMGRLRWDEPSVTIRTEFYKPEKGRYLHPVEDRPITAFEAARLMGFRDTHRWCGSKSAIARQIGNAVPPPLAGALARAVKATLMRAGAEPKRSTIERAQRAPSH